VGNVDVFVSYEYRMWIRAASQRNRGVEFLCGHHGGFAVDPFPYDHVEEAFYKFESTPRCEKKTFPELGELLKTCGEVGW
jgi:hypothetical protein